MFISWLDTLLWFPFFRPVNVVSCEAVGSRFSQLLAAVFVGSGTFAWYDCCMLSINGIPVLANGQLALACVARSLYDCQLLANPIMPINLASNQHNISMAPAQGWHAHIENCKRFCRAWTYYIRSNQRDPNPDDVGICNSFASSPVSHRFSGFVSKRA